MSSETQERLRRDYQENRILSAHPVEIVAMLYRVAVDNIAEAMANLRSGDRFARSKAVTKSEQAIHELLIALDHSIYPAFSRSSAELYRYALNRIVVGHAQESVQAFQEAMEALKPLQSAWEQVRAEICEEPQGAAEEANAEERAEPRAAVKDPYSAYREDLVAASSRDWSC